LVDFLAAFLAAGFFAAAFFFAAMCFTSFSDDQTRQVPFAVVPRVASWSLTDEDSETLAVERNGRLTRVGSVASVVATTSSIAIQVVVIPE
jgi:hypothetical protein